MNQKKLFYLIVFSAISVTSLIAIQLYWIKASVETQQQRFKQTVMSTMSDVVKKMEREEAITKITSSFFKGEELNTDFFSDSVIVVGKNDLSKAFQKKLTSNKPFIANTKSDELKIEFTPPPQNDSSYLIIKTSQKSILSSTIDYGNNGSINSQNKNPTLLNDQVNELSLITVSKNQTPGISYLKIDSLFKFELNANGIESDFIFDILDIESNQLTFSENPTESSEIMETTYRVDLFPNEFYIDSDQLLLYFPNQENYIVKNSWKILLISFLLICILIALFYTSISTIYRQKKLSQVKNDFINNMTHELKTPISTISLACEALGDDSISLDKSRRNTYVDMVKDENKRLSLLVDNVLKSATWDSADLELNLNKESLHQLIQTVVNSFEIQIKNRAGQLTLRLITEDDTIFADKVHLSNVIYNLLDNANKYSPDTPEIEIECKSEEDYIIFTISDKGLGISKDDQKKIFDKFYRVPTGNIHNVKGFGLGLNYVKRIVELHSGEIGLKSIKGKGTSIIIKFKQYGK